MRVLKGATPLEQEEEERMRSLARAVPDPQVARGKLLSEINTLDADIEGAWKERENEYGRYGQLRQSQHRLQAELLQLRRELEAAKRVESAAAAAVDSSTIESSLPAHISAPSTTTSVSQDAIKQQSRQLVWRWQELQQLNEKVDRLEQDRTNTKVARRQ